MASPAHPLITLHHLPGSGGTIFSKALASMDDVIVLSEIHPDRHLLGRFDPLVQLRSGYGDLIEDEDRAQLDSHFADEIKVVYDIGARHGRRVVIRDHSYRDFLQTAHGRSRLVDVLEPNFKLEKVLTLRDPVDCYLSYRALRDQAEGTLPEYDASDFCTRYLQFIDSFSDAVVVRYEDFVQSPALILESLSARLQLTFHQGFAERIRGLRHFTGDSGRRGDEIKTRTRRPIDSGTIAGFGSSSEYEDICRRLGYENVAEAGSPAAVPT